MFLINTSILYNELQKPHILPKIILNPRRKRRVVENQNEETRFLIPRVRA